MKTKQNDIRMYDRKPNPYQLEDKRRSKNCMPIMHRILFYLALLYANTYTSARSQELLKMLIIYSYAHSRAMFASAVLEMQR